MSKLVINQRKLVYAAGTSIAIVLSGVLAAYWPVFRGCLDMVIGGLIACLTVYTGGNVSQRFVETKNGTKLQEQTIYGKGGSIYEPGQPLEQAEDHQ